MSINKEHEKNQDELFYSRQSMSQRNHYILDEVTLQASQHVPQAQVDPAPPIVGDLCTGWSRQLARHTGSTFDC